MGKELITADNSAIEFAKEHFMRSFRREKDPLYRYMDRHVGEVEKWSIEIMKDYPEADRTAILLAVWLHDIGRFNHDREVDHAVFAESEVRRFLPRIGVSQETIETVAHCVRAHRNKDVQPQTIEAKILAAADSASHMTDIGHIVHIREGHLREYIEGKIERDYRDIALIPGLQKKLTPLYFAWKELIKVMPDPQN